MDKELNFRNVIEKIEILDKWLLLKLAIDVSTPKDRYLRNSIAKSIMFISPQKYTSISIQKYTILI